MRAHAVVIGIDHYTYHPEWNLTGATRDAVEFAKWVTNHGGVDPKDLTLLLSPRPAVSPIQGCTLGDPDWNTIATTLDAFESGQKKGADRFWFYYGGHGVAGGGEGPSAGPVLIPADTDPIGLYLKKKPLGIEMFRQTMQEPELPASVDAS